VLVIRTACELGKFPDEVMRHMDMDALVEFAGYLALQQRDEEKPENASVEETLIRTLGKPA
jgi:hypothetical protein